MSGRWNGRGGRAGSTVVTGGGGGTSDLALLAESMSSGDWSDFTMGGLTSNFLTVASESVQSAATFCARMVWDQPRGLVKFTNSSHTGGAPLADASIWAQWDDAANQWTRVPYVGDSDAEGHVYYHQCCDLLGNSYRRYVNGGRIDKLPVGDTAQNQWQASFATAPNLGNQFSGALEWFPDLNGGAGGLVFVDVEGAAYSNAALTNWTQSAQRLSGNFDQWIAKPRDAAFVYFGGGQGNTSMYRLDSSGVSSAALAVTPLAAGPNNASAIVLPHPNGTDLLLFSTTSNGAVHQYNAGSNSWSALSNHQISSGPNFIGVAIPEYGVVLFLVHQGAGTGTTIARVFKP